MFKTFRKSTAWLLTLAMLIGMLPSFAGIVMAAEEKAEEYAVVTESAAPETDLPDNDALFAGYAERLFNPYGGVSFFGIAAGSRLTGTEKAVYDALVPIIKKIASGERASSHIGLGQDITYDGKNYTADVAMSFTASSFPQSSLNAVTSALLADYPYEMYWYDKTTGVSMWYVTSGGNIAHLYFEFTVAGQYRGGNAYTADTAKTGIAKTAAAKAQNIVDKYASKSDYDKLLGYKNEICNLVSYNQSAADTGDFKTQSDPWQLIYVFDGDSTTNVVCEGYAKAFQYLCDLTSWNSSKIMCYNVSGYMVGGTGAGRHMWNIVTMDDGKNYIVDVTNCDTGSIGAPDKLFVAHASATTGEFTETDSYGNKKTVTKNGYAVAAGSNTVKFFYDDDMYDIWGSDASSILNISSTAYGSVAVHTHNTNGTVTYTYKDGAAHIKKTACKDCPDNYVTETTESHTGGTATCASGPVCEKCGNAYGEADTTTHVWTYTASGASITADCKNAGCDETGTITLKAPASVVYDGNDKTVTTEGTLPGVTDPAITYEGDRKNAGTFTAKLTVGTVTAVLDVTITPKTTTITSEPATPVNLGFIPTAEDQVIAVLPTTVTTADGAFAITWTCVSLSTAPNGESIFSWTITDPAWSNYTAAKTSGTVTAIGGAASSVTNTGTNTTITYNGTPFDVSTMFTIDANAGTATYTITNGTGNATLSGKELTVTSAGTITVNLTTAANGSYAAGEATAVLTVEKGTPSYTVPTGLTAEYGDTLADVTLPTGWTWKNTASSVGNAGNNAFTAVFTPANTALYNTAEVEVAVAVSPKNIAGAAVGSFGLTYIGEAQIPTASVTIDGMTVTGTWSAVTNVNDKTTFTASGNFTGTIADQTTGMAKADPVVTAPTAGDRTYDTTEKALAAAGSVTGGTMQYSTAADGTYTTAIPTAADAGEYKVYYKAIGDANHNDTAPQYITVTISPKTVTAPTFDGLAETYAYDNGNPIKPTFTLKDGENVIPASEYETAYENNTAAGSTAQIHVTDKPGGNYTVNGSASFAIVSHTHDWTYTASGSTITAVCKGTVGTCPVEDKTAVLTIKAPAGSLIYDGQVKSAVVEGEIPGVTTPEITCSGDCKNAGDYTASIKLGDAEASVAFTITRKAVTVTADAKAKSLGAADPELTYTAEGLVSGESLNGALTRAAGESAGTYNIEAGTVTDANNPNYTITYVGAVLTIGQNVITAADVKLDGTLTYDGSVQTQKITVTEGITFTVTDNTAKGAGTYILKVIASGDYTGEVEVTWTIAPKDITGAEIGTFTAMTYTGSAQTPNASVTADGLTVTGTWSDVTNVTDKTTFTATGNFTGTIADQTTGMTKAAAAYTAPEAEELTFNGTEQELLKAGTTEDGTMLYSLDETTWTETLPEAMNAGTYTVYYKVSGDENHEDSTAEKLDVTIAKRELSTPVVPVQNHPASTGAENNTVDISDLLPANAGEITFGTPTVTGDFFKHGTTVSAEGILTYSTETAESKKTGTITIPVTMENYADMIITVTVELNDKTTAVINVPAVQNGTYNGKSHTGYTGKPSVKDYTGEFIITYTGRGDTDYPATDKAPVNAGEYTVTFEIPETDLYHAAAASIDFTVAKAKVTVTADNQKAYIGFRVPALTYKVKGLVGKDTIKVKLACEADMTRLGKFPITVTVTEVSSNYEVTTKNGIMQVLLFYPYNPMFPDREYPIIVSLGKGGDAVISELEPKEGAIVDIIPLPYEGKELDTITVKDLWDRDIELTDNEDGTYSFAQPPRKVKVTITFKDAEIVVIEPTCKEDHTCPMFIFDDLYRRQWYHDGIHYCLENSLMNGTGRYTFEPDTVTNRAMIVTILWRLEGKPVVNYAMSFKDVPSDAWYTEAIRWAAAEGIVNGYSAAEFGPEDEITREQLATILYRYEQNNGGGFKGMWMFRMDYSDIAEVSDWAYEAMCWMSMNQVLNGKPGNLLDPQGSATRAEAATMLYRYCSIDK